MLWGLILNKKIQRKKKKRHLQCCFIVFKRVKTILQKQMGTSLPLKVVTVWAGFQTMSPQTSFLICFFRFTYHFQQWIKPWGEINLIICTWPPTVSYFIMSSESHSADAPPASRLYSIVVALLPSFSFPSPLGRCTRVGFHRVVCQLWNERCVQLLLVALNL